MSYWLLLRVSKTHETSKKIFDDLINAPECTFKFRIVQECCLYSWEKDTPPLVTHLTRPLLSKSRYCWKDLTIFANLHIWQHLFNGWVTKQRKVQPNGRFILWMVQPNRGFMQTESSAKWKVQPNICHCNQLYLDSQMSDFTQILETVNVCSTVCWASGCRLGVCRKSGTQTTTTCTDVSRRPLDVLWWLIYAKHSMKSVN